jgi:hypothetical protein
MVYIQSAIGQWVQKQGQKLGPIYKVMATGAGVIFCRAQSDLPAAM